MIKFTALVHKETGEIIKYEDWEKTLKLDMWFISTNSKGNKQFNYKPKEMLFLDDFEIIYDSEFTIEQLEQLCKILENECIEYGQLEDKIMFEKIEKMILIAKN